VDAVPVIARGHNVAACLPPVAEALSPLLAAVPRRPLLVLTADRDRALECVRTSGLTDATVASAGAPGASYPTERSAVFIGIADALDLVGRSSLRTAEFAAVVLAWPEQMDSDGSTALGAVMAECDRDAQRLIVTAAVGAPTDQLVERYAFKAMTYGFTAPAPAGPAGFVVAPASRLADWTLLVREALGTTAGKTPRAVVTCPRSHEEAVTLAAQGEPVLVLAPHQVAWARTVFRPLTPVPLPGATSALRRQTERVRADLARLVATEDLDRELLVLAPLLDAVDPTVVAAAALRFAVQSRGRSPHSPTPEAPPLQGIPAYAKLWVGIGRKDGVKPGDLVGALAHEAKVPADALGKIEVRDLFCLVEIRAEFAEHAVKALTGTTVRGRRLTARVDRGPGPGARPPRRA